MKAQLKELLLHVNQPDSDLLVIWLFVSICFSFFSFVPVLFSSVFQGKARLGPYIVRGVLVFKCDC